MSVRIQPGDRQPEGPGYVPDPYLDRVEDNTGIRSIFGSESGSEDSGSPFALKRPARDWRAVSRPPWPKIVAIAVLGSVALALLGAFVMRLGGSTQPTSAAVVPPRPSDAPSSPGPAPGDAAAEVELGAVSWQGAALPVSEQAGPRVFDEVRSYGFSHEELGAALAAVHLSTHLDALTGPPVFTAVIEQQSEKAPAGLADALRRHYEAQARRTGLTAAKIRRGAPIISPTAQIRAWRIAEFTPDSRVDVDLMVRDPSGADFFYRVPLVWRSGDWHLFLGGATPQRLFEPVPNPDPESFTPFTTGGTAQ